MKLKRIQMLTVFLMLAVAGALLLSGKRVSADDGWGTCGTNVNWHFYESTGLLEITGTGEMTSRSWGDYASKITSVTIGEGVTSICEEAFYGYNITSVTLPSTLNRIGKTAFGKTSSLTTVALPAALQKIEESAFSGSGLTGLVLPGSVTTMDSYAFSYCGSLSSVTLSAGLDTISYGCFEGCTALKTLTIPESITTLAGKCFAKSGLTGLQIPSSVTTLGYEVFYDCDSLQFIEIPSSVTQYEISWGYSSLCEGCDSLQYAVVNAPLTVPKSAFNDCPKLQAVKLGEGVTGVDRYNFNGEALIAVYLPQSVTSISTDSFDSSHIITFYSFVNSAAWSFAGKDADINFVDVSTESGAAQWNTAWTAATSLQELAPEATAAPSSTAKPTDNTKTKVSVAQVKKLKVKAKKKNTYKVCTLTWKKVSGATGYEVWYGKKKNGSYIKFSSNAYTNKYRCIISPKKRKYYYKVRAYKTVNGVAHYGKFSTKIRK